MSVACSDTAKIMWDDLKKRYGMDNTPKIHQLKSDIANCKQGGLEVGELIQNSWTCGPSWTI